MGERVVQMISALLSPVFEIEQLDPSLKFLVSGVSIFHFVKNSIFFPRIQKIFHHGGK